MQLFQLPCTQHSLISRGELELGTRNHRISRLTGGYKHSQQMDE